MSTSIEKIPSPTSLEIYHRGPLKEEGTLPALFYFALSGEESLLLSPFNQPVEFLADTPVRCFSFSLPGHGADFKNSEALAYWASEYRNGHDPLALFLTQATENIRFLIQDGWIDSEKIASSGLSRGGLVATLLSVMEPRIKWILGYAPVTHLGHCTEFQTADLADIAEKYSLTKLTKDLMHKTVRYYIGNRDLRVSTDSCYRFIRTLADQSYENNIRSPKAELIISASTGHLGHGTPPHIFQEGIAWLKKQWEL